MKYDKKDSLNDLRFVTCTHRLEWDAVKKYRNKYFFKPNNVEDPYTWTFEHKNHRHFVLYKGTDIVGYVHVQLWPKDRAAVRIIVIDEEHRKKNYGRELMQFVEKWLKLEGYKSVHIESSPTALGFYKRLHYIPMPFDDPDENESSPKDTPMGKVLSKI